MEFVEQLWRATTVAARDQEFDSTLLIGIAIGSALTLFTVFIILSFHIDRLYLPPKQPTNDRLYRPPPTAVAACSDETQHADGGDDAARRRAWLLAIARGARPAPRVTNELWVAYRVFVDQRLLIGKTTTTGFHSYAVAHALGVRPHPLGWSGTQAAELFGCLAEAGLLSAFRQGLHRAPSAKAFGVLGAAEAPASALAAYLEQTLAQYHGQFHLAASRKFGRFTAEAEGRWAGPYEFVQLADPQLGMYNDDSSWSEEVTMLKLAISHVNRLRPRFLLVSGDLTNAWPTISNTTELNQSNAAVIDAQVASFREALRELDPSIPVVLQPGNHDVGQNPSRASVEAYRARFGDDYCAYWVGGVKYVAINSQYYHTQCESAEAAALRAEQEAWVEDELSEEKTAGAAHVVLLSHISPFMGDENEETGFFNWQRAGRRWLLRVASQPHLPRGRVTTVLCGHYHQNHTAWSPSGIEFVTTSSCGGCINWAQKPALIAPMTAFNFKECVRCDDPRNPPVVCDAFNSGLRVVRVEKERISHRWFELANVPKTFDDCFDDTPSESGSSKMVNILEHAMDLPMFSGRHSWGDMRSAHADLRRRGSADEVDDAPFASSRPGSWTSSDGRPLLLPARSRTTNGLLKQKKK